MKRITNLGYMPLICHILCIPFYAYFLHYAPMNWVTRTLIAFFMVDICLSIAKAINTKLAEDKVKEDE